MRQEFPPGGAGSGSVGRVRTGPRRPDAGRAGAARAAAALVLVFLGGAVPWSGRAAAQVVINEVLYDPDGGDTGREFVELLNCGRDGVLLTGWVLESGNGANPDDWTVEWIGGDLDYLEAGGLFVIGEGDVLPPPDCVTALDLQNGPDGVKLTDGESVLDTVGWGEPLFPEYFEGSPAGDVTGGLSLARSPDCFDNDDNALDFIGAPPTPGARNSLTDDLALDVRHHGPVVLAPGAPVDLVCVVRNVGAMSAPAGSSRVELRVDGGDAPSAVVGVDVELSPRDSTEVALSWPNPPSGYHRAVLDLEYAPDCAPFSNTAQTSFTVGRPGGLLAVNEVMHSPSDGSTEWVELVCTSPGSVSVAGWMLGDGRDMFPVAVPETAATPRVAAGGFLLLAREPGLLSGLAPCPALGTDGWETLSSDDTVVLSDEFGTPMDRVTYERSWGGERGVSLERVRPDIAPSDATNWGSSVAPEGSTPGRVNSIHLAVTPATGRLVLSPNPLTPDGDGKGDRTLISFELPVARATARLTIFDATGRIRAVLMDQEPVSSRGELLWDGTGDDGAPLPSGLYVAYLEAIDARAGVYVTARTAVGLVR